MHSSLEQLQIRLATLPARERNLAIAGSMAAVVFLIYLIVFVPLHKAIDVRTARIDHKQQDLAWMQNFRAELQNLSNQQPTANNPGESLVVLIDRTARESGLGNAVTGQTPNGNGSMRVRLEGASFDSLIQ